MGQFNNYSAVIFWDFKRMDNVNYNFSIAEKLIEHAVNNKDEKFFYKPIYLILSSIIECTLYDFLKKINEHRYEKVPNLGQEEINAIQNMEVPNKLSAFNNICKKHLFLGKDKKIYEKIHLTSEVRNRIHIQNGQANEPRDESNLWTAQLVVKCGILLKEIFTLMCEKYPRPDHICPEKPELENFPSPWIKFHTHF